MQLKNDVNGRNLLDEAIHAYYQKSDGREIRNFLHSENAEWGTWYTHFLLDRQHVFRYSLGEDRGSTLVSLELAIGPHYFPPSAFWSYDDSQRFSLEASTEAVEKNLRLLDEFLGYPVKPLYAR